VTSKTSVDARTSIASVRTLQIEPIHFRQFQIEQHKLRHHLRVVGVLPVLNK